MKIRHLLMLAVSAQLGMTSVTGCTTLPGSVATESPREASRQAFEAGDLDAAERMLSKAISRTPDRADLWNARGYVRVHRHNPAQAVTDFLKAIQLDPSNVRYRSNLAVLLLETGDPAAALVELDRALMMPGPAPDLLNLRGLAQSRLGRHREAVRDFTRVLEQADRHAQAYANRGVAYAKLGAGEAAMADFERALTIDPSMRQAYESRGLVELVEGQVQGAIADFSKAIELGAEDGLVFYNRGVAFSLSGEKRAAERDYEAACRLGIPQGCWGLTEVTASRSDAS